MKLYRMSFYQDDSASGQEQRWSSSKKGFGAFKREAKQYDVHSFEIDTIEITPTKRGIIEFLNRFATSY